MHPPADERLRARLDADYSPSRIVPEFRAILARCRSLSDAAKETLPCELGVRYGSRDCELLHYFPPRRAGSPLLIYVHGGHWQELSVDDSCFAAEGMVEQGAAFVAIGYGLAPQRTLEAMTASVAGALAWVFDNHPTLGVDAQRVHAAGSSAGAHLLAMALGSGAPAGKARLAGATLLSGVYELSTIRLTYVNAALGLSEAAAKRNSPVHYVPLAASEVLLVRGATETAEYGRQHELMLNALRSRPAAHSEIRTMVCAGRNHFDLPLALGDPREDLGQAQRRQMRLGERT